MICVNLLQIIEGVDYLHRIFVTHRDLKPENLLLQSFKCVSSASAQLFDWRIKIVDFSLSNTHEVRLMPVTIITITRVVDYYKQHVDHRVMHPLK